MAISVKVDIGQQPLAINSSRIGRLLSADKDYATHIGIWDRIKDYFRPYNKSEVLEHLYHLIHSDNTPIPQDEEGKFAHLHVALNAFANLKALAKDDDKALFQVKENHYRGVDFYIGATCVKSLDKHQPDDSPVSLLAAYYLQQVNRHPEVKSSIGQTVQDILANDTQTAWGETAPSRLLIDMWRLSGESIIDGQPIFNGVTRMTEEEITDATNRLYHKLTPLQRAALVEVGSQSGFADVNLGLQSFPNAFIEHFALGGISTSVALQYHPESAELSVRQITRRLMNDEEHQHFVINGPKPDIYPHLQMVVALTISAEGQVECVDFHASEHVETARYPAGAALG